MPVCYMITDLIHLQGSQLIGGRGIYLMNIKGWINLLYTSAGIILALLLGLYSTYLIQYPIKLRYSSLINYIWIATISLLCGYGVYIGRFLRLNSWDIFRPRSLFLTLIHHIDRFTILFTFIIAIYYFLAYLIFSQICFHKPKTNE